MKSPSSYCYGGKHFIVPVFSKEKGILFEPDEIIIEDDIKNSRCVSLLGTLWQEDHFEDEIINEPVIVSEVREKTPFISFEEKEQTRVLDMPIKFPGTNYRIPSELSKFVPIIKQIADVEHSICPSLSASYYCYLTIDQGKVFSGTTQRSPGVHVDGFQGARVNPKVPINHSFIVSNTLPTVFYRQQFLVSSLHPSHDNYFLYFDQQVNNDSQWTPKPFQIVLMNPYTVHCSAVAEVDEFRTFMRLSYSVREFDRLGNAHNPLFKYNWKMVARDVASCLTSHHD